MKADPGAQLALLDLQAIDNDLDRNRHRVRTLPQTAEVDSLTERSRILGDRLVASATKVQDLGRVLTKAEDDVAAVRSRSERDSALLASGSVTSAKQLTDLEHEVASLARRQADLEDAELEVMEALEAAQGEHAALEEEATEVATALVAATTARDEALATLAADREDLGNRRAAVASGLPADLLGLYERLRSDGTVVAAGLIRYGRCEACQMELSTADVSTVRSAPADEVLRCPECRAILVRSAESGL